MRFNNANSLSFLIKVSAQGSALQHGYIVAAYITEATPSCQPISLTTRSGSHPALEFTARLGSSRPDFPTDNGADLRRSSMECRDLPPNPLPHRQSQAPGTRAIGSRKWDQKEPGQTWGPNWSPASTSATSALSKIRTRWPSVCQMGPNVNQGWRTGPERSARVSKDFSATDTAAVTRTPRPGFTGYFENLESRIDLSAL
jgi:hypothetical protein